MTQSIGFHPQPGALSGLAVGDLIAGKYRLERLIGKGGMGAVFAATQVDLGRTVAIKVLLPEILDEGAVGRFSREARVLAGLRSEHVTVVHDLGKLDNSAPYIVMEYLEGKDLHDLVEERGPLPPQEAAQYLRQACDALTEAHQHGIIHRDLKPANLFVTKRADGTALVKLLDFGISKATTGAEDNFTATATMTVLGSPSYMSPEQLVSTKTVDLRTDIWALGATLCELLTGRPPFQAPTLAELALKIHLSAPALPADMPQALREIIERCLQKEPEHRFQSAAELSAALEAEDPTATGPKARISLPAVEAQTAYVGPQNAERRPSASTGSSWGTTLERKKARSSRVLVFGAVGLALLAIAVVLGVVLVRRGKLESTGATSAAALNAEIPSPAEKTAPTPSNSAIGVTSRPDATSTTSVEPEVQPATPPATQPSASAAPVRPPTAKPQARPAKPSASAASPAPAPTPAQPAELL